MSEHEPFREPIPPVAAGVDRPLWSVMVPTYNCASYLRETLTSVLDQDPGPDQMQIEVVDDCSSDDPRAVVEELAGGRVGFHRQAQNVGHVRNFNTCLRRARGRIVHLLHGDDAVRDGFYRTMQGPLVTHPEVAAAFCRYISMDEDGNWETIAPLEANRRGILPDWLERIALGQRLQTPCMVVRRSVYEQLGGFDVRLSHCEDWEMWTRIAAAHEVWYEPEPLALYRVHGRSASDRSRRSGENVVDLRRAIDINTAALPPARADELTRRAREITAATAIRRAANMVQAGDTAAARAQVREALKTSRSPSVLERLAFFGAVWLRHRLRRTRGSAA
jgi:glycosyltransferase involved in cell wall biosynthesis